MPQVRILSPGPKPTCFSRKTGGFFFSNVWSFRMGRILTTCLTTSGKTLNLTYGYTPVDKLPFLKCGSRTFESCYLDQSRQFSLKKWRLYIFIQFYLSSCHHKTNRFELQHSEFFFRNLQYQQPQVLLFLLLE